MKNDKELAELFMAFAHPSRIAILRSLLTYSPSGQKFGELSEMLEMSPSTMTHHIREMEAAGVIQREMSGRVTWLRLNLDTLDSAIRQLTALCCCASEQCHSKNEEQFK